MEAPIKSPSPMKEEGWVGAQWPSSLMLFTPILSFSHEGGRDVLF